MKVPISAVIALSITVFIFIAAGIANVGSSNEIPVSEEFKSEDWVVTGTETRSNEIITQSGNVIIQSGGNLTLDNVTLKMNCSYDGQYNIEVQAGGRLYAYNNSNITASTHKAHYLFWVQFGSVLILENTSLSYCGYTSKSDSDYSYGLYICSSNVLIKNCTLEENNCGIYYLQNTYQSGKARIENCTITHNNQGISVDGGGGRYAAPYIANNTISFSSSHGIYCTHDNSSIINNTISYNGGNGIFCYESSYTSIENNSLLSNNRNGIEVAAGSCIEKITGNKIENSSYGLYCYSTGATTNISNLAENIILNGSVGIYCAESSVGNISKNIIKNFGLSGIYIAGMRSECNMSWNNITECSIGIYCDDTGISPKNKTIAHNDISSSTDSGLYCKYSSPQVIIGNKFSNNRLAINLLGASAEVDYLNNTFENNTEGILLQEWYLKVRARVNTENVEGAQVIVKNKLGEIVLNKTTYSAGYIEDWITEYKILNDYSKEIYTPHIITGYKQYTGNDTKVVSITGNGEEALDLTIPEFYPEKIVISGFKSEGQALTVSVVVVNNGTADVENVIVRFLCDNSTVEDQSISFIASGRNETAYISWSAVKGNHLFEVQIDPDKLIEERNNTVQDNDILQWVLINAKPIAVIAGGPLEVYTYEDVTFYANGSYDPDGGITGYYFEFGDGTSKNTTDGVVEHNYTCKGIYHAKVRVKDNFGVGAESDWSSMIVINVANRLPTANITASAVEVNTSTVIIFSGTESYDGEEPYELIYGDAGHLIVNYTWSMGDSKYRYGAIISYSYSDNGTYNVTLTVRDNDNEERTAFLLIVVNNRLPSSLFSIEPVVGYATTIFTFNASASYDSDGTVINYTWDFGDSSVGYGKIVMHKYTDDRNYTVKLTICDNDLAEASTTLILQILNSPPTAFFSLSKSIVSLGEQVEFNATLSFDSDDAISNYTWNFDDGTKGYGMLVSHTYTQPGRYFVTLTVFDDEVNMTYTMVVEVRPLPTWIELHYKEVYLVGAIFCILGAIFFSLRWYEEAKRKEKEVRFWAEKKGAEKEMKIEAEIAEWAEKKKKLKTVDERIREWAKKREVEKKTKEEKARRKD